MTAISVRRFGDRSLVIEGFGEQLVDWGIVCNMDEDQVPAPEDVQGLFRAGQVLAAQAVSSMFGVSRENLYSGNLALEPDQLRYHAHFRTPATGLVLEGVRAWQAALRQRLGLALPDDEKALDKVRHV